MSDETTLPTPTVTSNSQAARLACNNERARVLQLLAMAPEGALPEPIVQAITNGTPAAVFASGERVRAAKAAHAAGSPGAPASANGASKWSAITSRLNAQRRATDDATVAEGSAA